MLQGRKGILARRIENHIVLLLMYSWVGLVESFQFGLGTVNYLVGTEGLDFFDILGTTYGSDGPACSWRAMPIAMDPTPPEAPTMRTESLGCTLALSRRACKEVVPSVAQAAAFCKETCL